MHRLHISSLLWFTPFLSPLKPDCRLKAAIAEYLQEKFRAADLESNSTMSQHCWPEEIQKHSLFWQIVFGANNVRTCSISLVIISFPGRKKSAANRASFS
jgi:hypothetical protein